VVNQCPDSCRASIYSKFPLLHVQDDVSSRVVSLAFFKAKLGEPSQLPRTGSASGRALSETISSNLGATMNWNRSQARKWPMIASSSRFYFSEIPFGAWRGTD